MKKIIFTIMILGICSSCYSGIKTEPINDSLTTHYPINRGIEINYVYFNFDNIVDFIYDPATNSYIIEYDDQDAWDYDFIADMSKEPAKDYIPLNISEKDFFEILKDYNKSNKEKFKIETQEIWVIKEITTPIEKGLNFTFYLLKNPMYED